jgi:guanylate kinase
MPVQKINPGSGVRKVKMHGDKIICLVGESGSGKTAIAKAFEAAGYNVIQSFTTRQKRSDDEWGHTFVKDIPRNQVGLMDKTDMIAYTFYNGHHYWATRAQYQGKGTTIYVIDPAGIDVLKRTVNDAELLIIYLKVDQKNRVYRMEQQGRSEVDIFNRCLIDERAFQHIECDAVVDANGPLDEVVQLIKDRFITQ